jgi:hypothetical protein
MTNPHIVLNFSNLVKYAAVINFVECRILLIIMLNVVMLSVVMQRVMMPLYNRTI